jgi:hypothetical protein
MGPASARQRADIDDTRHAPMPAVMHDRTRVTPASSTASRTAPGLPSLSDSFERKIDAMWGPADSGGITSGQSASDRTRAPAAALPFDQTLAPGARSAFDAPDPGVTLLDPAWARVERALVAAGVEPGTSSVPADSEKPPGDLRTQGIVEPPVLEKARAERSSKGPIRDAEDPRPARDERPGLSLSPPPIRHGWAAVLGEDLPAPEPGRVAATVVSVDASVATAPPMAAAHDALDALSARPPLDAESRYERLKGGIERDERSPGLAALWSLLAPGAGQAYNGQPARGVTFALAGILVIPWFVSIFDAVRVSRALRDGRRRGRPQATRTSLMIVVGWWGFVVASLFGVQALDRVTTPPPIVVEPPTVDRFEGSGVPHRDVDPNPGPEVDRGPAEQRAEIRRQVDVLVYEARSACEAGRCDECVRIVEEALVLDESSRAAQQLHVEAIAALGAGRGCRTVGQRADD